jgi:hypothetical protein
MMFRGTFRGEHARRYRLRLRHVAALIAQVEEAVGDEVRTAGVGAHLAEPHRQRGKRLVTLEIEAHRRIAEARQILRQRLAVEAKGAPVVRAGVARQVIVAAFAPGTRLQSRRPEREVGRAHILVAGRRALRRQEVVRPKVERGLFRTRHPGVILGDPPASLLVVRHARGLARIAEPHHVLRQGRARVRLAALEPAVPPVRNDVAEPVDPRARIAVERVFVTPRAQQPADRAPEPAERAHGAIDRILVTVLPAGEDEHRHLHLVVALANAGP